MLQIRNNQYRARQVRWLLMIIIIFDVLIIVFDIKEFTLLSNLESHLPVTAYDAGANDIRQTLSGIFYFVTALCSGIAFLGWFYRAYVNLARAGLGTRYPVKYAIISFFIPPINLYFPYRIMCEIWSKTSAVVFSEKDKKKQSGMKSLHWWWILWLTSIFLAAIYFYAAITVENIHDFKIASLKNIISHLIDIPAAVVTIILVGKVANIENQWYNSIKDQGNTE
jgi:uncharacterized membrane protein YhaH (DUF805 family)